MYAFINEKIINNFKYTSGDPQMSAFYLYILLRIRERGAWAGRRPGDRPNGDTLRYRVTETWDTFRNGDTEIRKY